MEQLGRRPHQPRAHPAAHLEDRSAGAIVDEQVVVEVDERAGIALDLEGAHRRRRRPAGVDPPGQHHDEAGRDELGNVRDEAVVAHLASPPGVTVLRVATRRGDTAGARFVAIPLP